MRTLMRRDSVLRYQQLEPRYALSAAPVVSSVEFSGAQWDTDFTDYLGGGFLIETGNSDQLKTLPWLGVDQVSIAFDQDVDIQANDLAMTGVNILQYEFSDFVYDPQAFVATWTLTQSLDEDRILLDLNADGFDPIVGMSGLRLDGEWTDEVSTFNSGDGTEGGDFEFTFTANPGDADRHGWVDYYDYVFTYYSSGLSTSDPSYEARYDIDGSGTIDSDDYDAVYAELGGLAPSSSPAGASNNAPTTSNVEHLSIDDPSVAEAVSLWGLFDDPEDSDAALQYSVVSNNAAGLFDSVTIDSTNGELVFDAASGESGRATLVVEAVDSGGLATQATITVDVDYDNAAPVIEYTATPYPADTWVISGTVTDADDDPTNWIVEFTGAFVTRAAVYPDGTFEFAVILDGGEYGWLIATVSDPHGATDEYWAFVGIS